MRFTKRSVAVAIVAAGLAATLAACTSPVQEPNPAAQSAATSSTGATAGPSGTSATPEPSATASVVTDIKNQPGSSDGYVGALKDVTVKKCEAETAPASFSGVVKNPQNSTQSYRIYVSLLSGSKTIGVSQVNVDKVPAGAEQEWSGTLNVGEKGARCVLRVERTAV